MHKAFLYKPVLKSSLFFCGVSFVLFAIFEPLAIHAVIPDLSSQPQFKDIHKIGWEYVLTLSRLLAMEGQENALLTDHQISALNELCIDKIWSIHERPTTSLAIEHISLSPNLEKKLFKLLLVCCWNNDLASTDNDKAQMVYEFIKGAVFLKEEHIVALFMLWILDMNDPKELGAHIKEVLCKIYSRVNNDEVVFDLKGIPIFVWKAYEKRWELENVLLGWYILPYLYDELYPNAAKTAFIRSILKEYYTYKKQALETILESILAWNEEKIFAHLINVGANLENPIEQIFFSEPYVHIFRLLISKRRPSLTKMLKFHELVESKIYREDEKEEFSKIYDEVMALKTRHLYRFFVGSKDYNTYCLQAAVVAFGGGKMVATEPSNIVILSDEQILNTLPPTKQRFFHAIFKTNHLLPDLEASFLLSH